MEVEEGIKTLILTLIFILFACSCQSSWVDKEISKPGTYRIDKNLELRVGSEKGYLEYSVVFNKKEKLLTNSRDISSYQGWGVFVDKQKNLWVFSSDIGTSRWNYNAEKQMYTEQWFYRRLKKDEVPARLQRSFLKKYLDE